jgi:hypothetical protein
LKIRTARRYLRSIGCKEYENFIGFRYDEKDRVAKREQPLKTIYDKFPLFDDGTTKSKIDSFWNSKPYQLKIPRILGNCVLCPLKGKNAIMAILREFPEFATAYIQDEQKSVEFNGQGNGRTYLQGTTIQNLLFLSQNTLFKDYPLEKLSPEFHCVCG